MTKRSKRILFYSAVAIFLLLSYVIILYAQGYKYSFSERKFSRTGAISLKTNTDADVLLDDKLDGGTSFFNNSYSIDRLLPGTYKLTVQKEDHSVWQKRVTVEEGLVVDFPEILLLPEEGEEEQKLFEEVRLLFESLEPIPTIKPSPSIKPRTAASPSISPSPQSTPEPTESGFVLDSRNKKLFRSIDQELVEIAENVDGFRLSENENKIAWWNKNEIWIMWLNDQNFQPFHKKGEKELVTRFLIPIQNATWFRGENHIILELEQKDSKGRLYSIYRIIEIDKRGGVNIIEL